LNVKTLCLGFLSTREASGYEIKKEFEDGLFSHFIEASFGSIYPALNQLTAEGFLTVREEEQSGKPDKKVYAITPSGHAKLSQWLQVVPARDKFKSEFLFEMFLQHYLVPGHIAVAIEKQLADMRADLQQIEECRSQAIDHEGSKFVVGYAEAVLTAGVSYLEDKLRIATSKAAVAAE
jgi:PadR family transcriptional regulator, regulatory protein AphA